MVRPGFARANHRTRKNVNSILDHKILSHFPNVAFNVVAIAASAGGLEAISEVLSALPPDFPAAIAIVQHMHPYSRSYMAKILNTRTALRVKQADSEEMLRPGRVYIAAPNKHLVVKPNGTLFLSDAAKVNFVRPSANVLFQSLAISYKARAIAVVLTGKDTDGVMGVLAIKKHGGIAIAQDEHSCKCFDMPKAAITTGKVDLVLPLEAIATTLVSLVSMEKAASQDRVGRCGYA